MRKINALYFSMVISFTIFFTNVLAVQPIAYGPTNANDQLWQIAVSLRPNTTVTVEQTMLAILKVNPDAFNDANAYKLKPGYVLTIPTLDVIKKTTSYDAAWQIKKQHNAFLGIKEKLEKSNIGDDVKPKKDAKENKGQVKLFLTEEYEKKIAIISQHYQEQLGAMQQTNHALQAKLDEANSSLNILKQQVQKEAEESNKKKQLFKLPSFLWGRDFFSADELKLLAVLALMLIIWWSLLHYRRSKLENTKFKSEYDFMSGLEGMNAKLDLAQAYIDMSDKESARKVLAEVMGFGDSKQKAEAEELLKKCV